MTALAEKTVRSARKPKGEGHVRRAEILAAAERIFVECGYEGATIRKIADEVGVSSTALYMHFPDKSAILLEICESAFGQMIAGNEAIKAKTSEPVETVRRLLDAYMHFGLDNPNAYHLVFCTRFPEASEDTQSVVQRLGRQVFDNFAECVAAVAASGRLKAETEVAAQALWAGAHGIVSLVITKPYFAWADQRVLTTTMLDALFEGLVRT